LQADYVTVVEYRPIMSVKYCPSVPVFHFWPKLMHPAAWVKLKTFPTLVGRPNYVQGCTSFCVCVIQEVVWAAESPDVMIDGEDQCGTISLPADSKYCVVRTLVCVLSNKPAKLVMCHTVALSLSL